MGVGYTYSCSNCDYSEVVSPDQYYLKEPDGSIQICDDDNLDAIFDFFEEHDAWKKLKTTDAQKAHKEAHSGFATSFVCKSCRHSWLETGATKKPECPSCSSNDTADKWFQDGETCLHCNAGKISRGKEPDWIS